MPDIKHEARELLKHQKELSEITVWQLKQLLLNAAEGPITNPEQRALVEIRQRFSRHRTAGAARRAILRCRHQNAYQRYAGVLSR
jgi:hypothetical protein